MPERHIKVAQGMHSQYRHGKIAMHFGQPAHAIGAWFVGVGFCSDARYLTVESLFILGWLGTRSPSIRPVGIVVYAAGKNPAHGAVIATTGQDGILESRLEAVREYRALTPGQMHGHQLESFAIEVGRLPRWLVGFRIQFEQVGNDRARRELTCLWINMAIQFRKGR